MISLLAADEIRRDSTMILCHFLALGTVNLLKHRMIAFQKNAIKGLMKILFILFDLVYNRILIVADALVGQVA